MRQFPSGAIRDSNLNKPHYEGYFSPLVIKRFGRFMLEHETLADGSRRAPDNWQQGFGVDATMDSLWRHFVDLCLCHDGFESESREDIENTLCAIIFNAQSYLYEILKPKRPIHEAHPLSFGHPSRQCLRNVASFVHSVNRPAGTSKQIAELSLGVLDGHDPLGDQIAP